MLGIRYLSALTLGRFVNKTSGRENGYLILLILLVSCPILPAATVNICDEASLRAAMQMGGTVTFACDGTITLTSTLRITNEIALDATGRQVLLSGGNIIRIFEVMPDGRLRLHGLTLANGRSIGTNGAIGRDGESVGGAAILNLGGTVGLVDCVLSNNHAMAGRGGDIVSQSAGGNVGNGGEAAGGAISSLAGSLVISNCLLVANSVTGGRGGYAGPHFTHGRGGNVYGGAVSVSNAHLLVVGSEIAKSVAVGGEAAGDLLISTIYGTAGLAMGGALFAFEGTAELYQARFTSNSASGQGIPTRQGRAGNAYGGAAYFSNAVASVDNSGFLSNVVVAGTSGSAVGVGDFGSYAGALFNAGPCELRNSIFQANRVKGGDGRLGRGGGGAIYNAASLVLNSCTLDGNLARGGTGQFSILGASASGLGCGGGIQNLGTLLATNCTLARNIAQAGPSLPSLMGPAIGGGLFQETGSSVLTHVTIAENLAISTRTVLGGGIASSNSGVRLQNTLLAYNTSGSNYFGVLIDDGNNISSDASCPFTAPGSLSNTDPVLSPLDDFGGRTPTMALLAGSPAIDHGLASFCPATDQRGRPRPHGAGCDVGAFESGPPFSIRGQITGYMPPGGIAVQGGSTSAVSTASGIYTLWNLPAGSYMVAPSSAAIVAVPPSQTLAVGPDAVGVDFRSYRFNAFTVEGYTNDIAHLIFAGTNTLNYEVQTGTNLVDWIPISTNVVGSDGLFHLFYTNGPMRFFRTLGR
jgi:hypothetical protein